MLQDITKKTDFPLSITNTMKFYIYTACPRGSGHAWVSISWLNGEKKRTVCHIQNK